MPNPSGDQVGCSSAAFLGNEQLPFMELLSRVELEPIPENEDEVDEMGFIPPNQLPEESIETDAFYNSYSNKNDCSYSEAVSASNTSRCFSSFNQSDAESAPQEVSSAKNDNLSETIEASVRKYCEDKSYDMFKPEIGMRFDTCEDAYKFYNMYSWVLGFIIRCGDNYTNTKKNPYQSGI
ncbi:uncharacterized protein LOC124702539 [Lolium rigidum]|uniref:uncharacterized protein LOC124702539 n=1 Tax=Lolium rigidum TaxID=89674 RepID=UPI001F5D128B|nr:uncharacterized protein LOC124702539 [Lolium rigidum]